MLDVAALRIGIPWTFHFCFAYVRALRCPKLFRRSVGSNTKGPYAAQLFRNIRTAILSAITIRKNTYAVHTFRNVGTPPHSPCIAVRTGLMLPKIVRTWVPTLFVCHT